VDPLVTVKLIWHGTGGAVSNTQVAGSAAAAIAAAAMRARLIFA
jgi:hypothetical protein